MESEQKRRTRERRKEEQRAWATWQANPVPVGAPVEVTKDDGSKAATKTRSSAWQLGDGTPVVMVDGISGGYLLTRVRVIAAKEGA